MLLQRTPGFAPIPTRPAARSCCMPDQPARCGTAHHRDRPKAPAASSNAISRPPLTAHGLEAAIAARNACRRADCRSHRLTAMIVQLFRRPASAAGIAGRRSSGLQPAPWAFAMRDEAGGLASAAIDALLDTGELHRLPLRPRGPRRIRCCAGSAASPRRARA